jgi:hypothetical protein
VTKVDITVIPESRRGRIDAVGLQKLIKGGAIGGVGATAVWIAGELGKIPDGWQQGPKYLGLVVGVQILVNAIRKAWCRYTPKVVKEIIEESIAEVAGGGEG